MYKKETWSHWHLTSDRGRSVWQFRSPAGLPADWSGQLTAEQEAFIDAMSKDFIYDKKQNPNSGDRVYRSQRDVIELERDRSDRSPRQAAREGIRYYQTLQTKDGNWPGDYGGPMFLLPGLVIAAYVTESPFTAPEAALMRRYMLNHQNDDGGWGLHLEGRSTTFGTVLQYVALRLLGASAQEREVIKARQWIQSHGGATGIPSWGKFYLSLLGVYEWEGCNTLLPELWLLPKSLAIHPSHYWCHTRMVYLPMAYCYGHKVVMQQTALTSELRAELYTQDYEKIRWSACRDLCSDTDVYFPQSATLKSLNGALNVYEKFHLKGVREKALKFALDYINAEDQQTNYINIGPVNQAINSIAIWHAYGRESEQFKRHRERWADYLWVAEDGMKMQGYNGSQLWDTAFAMQAVAEAGMDAEFPQMIQRGHAYVDTNQIRGEVVDREKFFRHTQIGGWPFSNVDHGWPITDCTAEGMKTYMLNPDVDPDRLYQAVNVILSYQNPDGGCASYELTRSPQWVELLNPSEIFGNIMIDYSYTECTSACVQGLIAFHLKYPDHRTEEVKTFIEKGVVFILKQQRPDGSWYGSWAVCFTYGTWFGVEALSRYVAMNGAGWQMDIRDKAKAALKKANVFLLSKQNADGGWGESFESCVRKEYIPSEKSQVVNTSWALLSLLAAGCGEKEKLEQAAQLIISRQENNGDWPQENISGVFNHNCMITYTSYRNVFPIWALGRYAAPNPQGGLKMQQEDKMPEPELMY
ncbi:MAG: terpene cyclase/mutase family protein [Bacteroidetes bacterium]|nr:terpene cyclase/mutase family protein [Bacteroidota bacterium]